MENIDKKWDERVLELKDDEKKMIWYAQDFQRNALDKFTVNILSMFKNCTVLDIGCGFGRLCEIFKPENYLGIDFSEEMIKLAREKYPDYHFKVEDKMDFAPEKKYDIILGVMAPDIDFFKDFADVALIEIRPTTTKIIFNRELSNT